MLISARAFFVISQSFIFQFQLVAWVGGGLLTAVAWAITGILSAFCVGIVLIPLALLVTFLPLAALVYGVIAGIQRNSGVDFRYWLVGE